MMAVVLPILYSLLFIFLIYKLEFFHLPLIPRRAIVVVFILKLIAGTVLWWLYSYHYPGADLLDYFNDGKTLFDILLQNPRLFFQIIFNEISYPGLRGWQDNFEHILYNDAHTMIVLNTILHFFSLGHFHVHTVFMCFFSLLGLTALFKAFLPYLENGKRLLFVFVFMIPSVLFWSSGVLKEGFVFFGVGALLYATCCGLRTDYNWKSVGTILFSIIILLLVKFYVLAALIPGFLLNVWIARTSPKKILLKYLVVIFVLALGTVGLSLINKDYNPLKIISDKQTKAISEAQGGVFLCSKNHFVCIEYNKKEDFLTQIKDSVFVINPASNYLQWELDNMNDTTFVKSSTDTAEFTLLYEVIPANTVLKINRLKPTFYSVLQNAPYAFLTVLVQPVLWNVKGAMQLLTALENVLVMALLIITLLFFKKENKYMPLIIFCLSFVVILYILIGSTTPVTGAIVRYKVPALPFLCIALLMLTNKKKLAEKFPVIEKWLL